MALPSTIVAASPAGNESPSLGDDQFRALKDAIESILGIPDNTAVSVAYLVGAATGLTAVALRDSTANPSAAGRLQRNGAALLFHDGTAARTLADTATLQVLDAKALTALVRIVFADQAVDASTAGELLQNGRRLSFFDGGSAVRMGGVLNIQTAGVGNVTGGEDTLMTYTLPANTLNANNRALRITAWGDFAANGNTKTIKFKWGSSSITLNPTTTAPNGTQWRGEINIVRTGASTQYVIVDAFGFDPALGPQADAAGAQTDTNAIVISFTGESGSSATDDIRQLFMMVEVLN